MSGSWRSGVKLEERFTDDEIKQAFVKNLGKITYACKSLGVTHSALTRYIERNPHVREFVKDLRCEYVETRLDAAEAVLDALLKRHEIDPKTALQSAIYILNNLGKERGYAHPNSMGTKLEERLEKIDIIIDSQYQQLGLNEVKPEANTGIQGIDSEDQHI